MYYYLYINVYHVSSFVCEPHHLESKTSAGYRVHKLLIRAVIPKQFEDIVHLFTSFLPNNSMLDTTSIIKLKTDHS